ncbi:MAG: (2Fe-2S) ferredoxin domain-containing protein [bacterium]
MQLTVCVGSCCYSKGAQEIIDFIKSDYPDVEVVGAFCLGSCSQGVSIKIDGKIRLIKNCDDIKNIMKELK